VKAGFGVGVITPQPPVFLAGFGARSEPATSVHDDLEARAIVLDDGSTTLCLIVCDLLGMSAEYADPVRDAVASELGIPREAVLTSCTHTHSGPSAMAGTAALGWHNPDGYTAVLVAGCLAGARAAAAALEDATLHFVRAPLPEGLSHNRRGLPYDPWFCGVDVRRGDGTRVGVLANVAVHPVSLGAEWMQVSCDWVRAFRETLESDGGDAIMLSGALGDVNPREWETYEGPGGSYERTAALGADIAAAVLAALPDARPGEDTVRVVSARTIRAPVDPTPLAALSGGADTIPIELVEWDVGGWRLVSIPGEAFHAFGREVDESRDGRALLAAIAPVWRGYFPHPWGAGYEETVSFGERTKQAVLEAILASASATRVDE
jgi:hypothetical protein